MQSNSLTLRAHNYTDQYGHMIALYELIKMIRSVYNWYHHKVVRFHKNFWEYIIFQLEIHLGINVLENWEQRLFCIDSRNYLSHDHIPPLSPLILQLVYDEDLVFVSRPLQQFTKLDFPLTAACRHFYFSDHVDGLLYSLHICAWPFHHVIQVSILLKMSNDRRHSCECAKTLHAWKCGANCTVLKSVRGRQQL